MFRPRCVACHRETQGVGTESRDAFAEFLAGRLCDRIGLFRVHQSESPLLDKRFDVDTVDQVDRIQRIAFGLGHFLAAGIPDKAVDVNGLERYLAGEVQGHHDHAGDPEENDVEAGYQHRRRQNML